MMKYTNLQTTDTNRPAKEPAASYGLQNLYICSPMNYIGGKYKLLPQIIPLFPKKTDTFIDLI